MHFGQFLGFAAVSLALALVPGPSWIYVISTTVSRHHRAGLMAVLGNATGIICHVLAVALGLSAVLSYSTPVYVTVKWLGAFYLLYLGIRTMWQPAVTHHPRSPGEANEPSVASMWRVFGHGVLVNLLNPKVALVMLALLPQFTDPAVGWVPGQIFVIGLTHALIASVVLVTIVFVAAGTATRLRDAPRLGRGLRIVAGLMLVGVGLRLALSRA